MQRKTVTILLRTRVRGHFVMPNTKYHESHYVTVLDNPLEIIQQPELPEILPLVQLNVVLNLQLNSFLYAQCTFIKVFSS